MKVSELQAMSRDALMQELVRLRREQFDIRLQAATGQGVRPHQKGRLRKDIARVKTILRERENAELGS